MRWHAEWFRHTRKLAYTASAFGAMNNQRFPLGWKATTWLIENGAILAATTCTDTESGGWSGV
jgi:hypothetical protein